jgi:hypothetical protein
MSSAERSFTRAVSELVSVRVEPQMSATAACAVLQSVDVVWAYPGKSEQLLEAVLAPANIEVDDNDIFGQCNGKIALRPLLQPLLDRSEVARRALFPLKVLDRKLVDRGQ